MAQIEEIILPVEETINLEVKVEPFDLGIHDDGRSKATDESFRDRDVEKVGEIFRTSDKQWRFACYQCPREFDDFPQFSSHAEEHLKQIFASSFDSKSELDENEYREREFSEDQFSDESMSEDDFEDAGNKKRSNSQNLDRESESKGAWSENKEEGEEDFPCTECDKSFTRINNLRRHMLKIHKKHHCYRCGVCDKEFLYMRDLTEHNIEIHNAKRGREEQSKNSPNAGRSWKKPYTCSECGKSFSSGWSMRRHQSVHSSERAFSCKICRKKFSSRELVLNHFKLEHKLKENFYDCDIVQEVQSSSGKYFDCDFCHKTLRKEYRDDHMRLHTNERPYQCTVCGKTFSMSRGLGKHMACHAEERKFKCDVCPKSYTRSYKLKLHRTIHTGEFIYKCTDCGKGFTEKRSLKKHMLSYHSRPLDESDKGNAINEPKEPSTSTV